MDFCAENLVAYKGYDTEVIADQAKAAGMQVVIPPHSNRKHPREYDEHIYALRHLIENTFMRLKEWRGIATRYTKRASSFLAAVQLHCALLWASSS